MTDKARVVCGRSYKLAPAAQGVSPRVIVDGITHSKGLPIRFKSVERAERHIRNMRLEQ